ncbi:orotidine 5'-phosphate decarboxylase [Fadolivirus algeromassiliense]|jgi:uridine monophosphate synthetase|uniref:Uridine 5'-monophosphate synthase n=1 Tax=Fadolivirus FV1/VV64 TaxID=3070911 RepID=A0A7D3UPI9_9VIRU|nr:orotidine 5'-phosphate decarboxylase [Fadolivirus algeromassiliense]QKF93968.1 orotidine 5'-phosphate decarboxylase [Fadolivirus FV1/VV64]
MDTIQQLKAVNLIKTGDFILKSGQKSNLYFDFKGLNSYPKLISTISYELSKLITGTNVCIAGVPLGGISYAVIVSQIKNLPMILIREEKKNYGTCQQIEGDTFGKELILIEDVITTGSSVINTLKILESNQIKVKQILCILDREAGGVETLTDMGYRISSLFTMSQIVNHKELPYNITIKNPITQKLMDIIKLKQTNLIASLDITDEYTLLTKLGLIGDHICAVKIHYDILDSISPSFVTHLNLLKQKHNFLVIEDRKFADIPFISIQQLKFIKLFADMVTVHGVCGEKLIEEIDKTNIGILLIHQLSIENNLIDNMYSNKVKDMSNKFNNIVGFISQEKVLNDYLTFTPGINLTVQTDNKGQIYRNMDKCDSDIFIVGRGIYESDDIVNTAKTYQTLCYNKWKY